MTYISVLQFIFYSPPNQTIIKIYLFRRIHLERPTETEVSYLNPRWLYWPLASMAMGTPRKHQRIQRLIILKSRKLFVNTFNTTILTYLCLLLRTLIFYRKSCFCFVVVFFPEWNAKNPPINFLNKNYSLNGTYFY